MKCAWIIGVGVVVLSAGCMSARVERQASMMRQEQEEANLQTDVQRLKEKMRDVGTAQQDVYRDVEACREAVRSLEMRLDRELSELRTMIKALEDARVRDREQIVEAISKRVGQLVGSPSAGSRTSSHGDRGYEHTVQPGQTLSEIAKAYNVRPDVIVRANNLSNPNAIRVGQVLFIPE